MKHTAALDYALGEGWLAPWVEGIRVGRAVASHCIACDVAQFPPLRTCPVCRQASDGWVTLTGRATILFRTSGSDGDFALAQFDGAAGGAVLRCDRIPCGATRGIFSPSPDDRPIMQLEPEPET